MSRGHSSLGTTFRLPTNGNQRYTLSPAAVQGSVRYCSSWGAFLFARNILAALCKTCFDERLWENTGDQGNEVARLQPILIHMVINISFFRVSRFAFWGVPWADHRSRLISPAPAHCPWSSKTFRQALLIFTRFVWRQPRTEKSPCEITCLQYRFTSREHARCSCGVPLWASIGDA